LLVGTADRPSAISFPVFEAMPGLQSITDFPDDHFDVSWSVFAFLPHGHHGRKLVLE